MHYNNLKDYYSEEQVISLLGKPVRCKKILRIAGKLFFPRSEIDAMLRERTTISDLIKVETKILSTPAYSLDLNKWLSLDQALAIIPYSSDMLLKLANRNDLLKPIRTRRVYDVTFYNKRDILKLLSTRPVSKYYNISYAEMLTIDNDGDCEIIINKECIGAWYSPKEARLVLLEKRRDALDKFKQVIFFGNRRFIYIPEIHSSAPNGYMKRAKYIHENRLYNGQELWSDWLPIGTIGKLVNFTHRYISGGNILKIDIGGILAYNKTSLVNWLVAENKVRFPLKNKFGQTIVNMEELAEAIINR